MIYHIPNYHQLSTYDDLIWFMTPLLYMVHLLNWFLGIETSHEAGNSSAPGGFALHQGLQKLCLSIHLHGDFYGCLLIDIWLVVWNMNFIFPYIGLLIIPIDVHIFQRGGPTTNQILIDWNNWMSTWMLHPRFFWSVPLTLPYWLTIGCYTDIGGCWSIPQDSIWDERQVDRWSMSCRRLPISYWSHLDIRLLAIFAYVYLILTICFMGCLVILFLFFFITFGIRNPYKKEKKTMKIESKGRK